MKGLFSYPDVVVICGEPQYHDEHRDVVINPAVIIEVLSESTEARSRGKVSSLSDLEPGADGLRSGLANSSNHRTLRAPG